MYQADTLVWTAWYWLIIVLLMWSGTFKQRTLTIVAVWVELLAGVIIGTLGYAIVLAVGALFVLPVVVWGGWGFVAYPLTGFTICVSGLLSQWRARCVVRRRQAKEKS